MIHAALSSYAVQQDSVWILRSEDTPEARGRDLRAVSDAIHSIGRRLDYTPRAQADLIFWDEGKRPALAFLVLASACLGGALASIDLATRDLIVVIPGGRAALVAYKVQRDPSFAETLKAFRLVKFRLLRALAQFPVLTRDSFEEQISGDPVEQTRGQMMMF
jgi:hypothetical protein